MTPVEKYGKLSVSGRELVDKNGERVQLKGISTHDLSWYPQYVNEGFVRQMRDEWNADLLRLAMYTAEEDGYCVGDDANRQKLQDLVEKGVKIATELGMYVIVDWHILSDSNPLQYKEPAKEFFARMSAKFADYENVIYEICNEPNVDAVWDDVYAYANEIIPIIRKNDTDAVILVGTPVWSQRVDEAVKKPVTGFDNLMYVLHFYADTHRDDLRKLLADAHDAGLPVFVSEFGICDASGAGDINVEQGDKWLSLLNERNISYCIWNISNKDETSAMFVPECEKVNGFTAADLRDQAKWYLSILNGN